METRHVIKNGQVVGELSFDEGTPESVWQLAMKAYQPQLILPEDHQAKILIKCMNFGKKLMAEFGARNLLLGIPNSDTLMLAQRLGDLKTLVESGSLDTALYVISTLPEDEYVTADVKEFFSVKIEAFLFTI